MKEPDKLKESIFHTPKGYFDQLPGRIQKRVEQEQQSAKTIFLPRWAYAVAASGVVLLVAGLLFFQQTDHTTDTLTTEQNVEQLLASVSDEEMINYLQTQTEPSALELVLTEEDQEEILLHELENYDISLEDYAYELEYLEEYL